MPPPWHRLAPRPPLHIPPEKARRSTLFFGGVARYSRIDETLMACDELVVAQNELMTGLFCWARKSEAFIDIFRVSGSCFILLPCFIQGTISTRWFSWTFSDPSIDFAADPRHRSRTELLLSWKRARLHLGVDCRPGKRNHPQDGLYFYEFFASLVVTVFAHGEASVKESGSDMDAYFV